MRRSERKALSRYTVLGAAASLFEAQGYESTTIRAVAAEAGYSTGAVFSHWPDKAALYAAVYGQPPCPPGQVRWVPIEQLNLTERKGGDTNHVILGRAGWDGPVSREWHSNAFARLVLSKWEDGPTHFLVGLPSCPAVEEPQS